MVFGPPQSRGGGKGPGGTDVYHALSPIPLRGCERNAPSTLGLRPRLGPITRFVNDILDAYDSYGD
jgi:hypothetical protein